VAELKTRPTDRSVEEFIDAIPDGERRDDCRTVMRLMNCITGAKAQMWGTSIVGFGSYRYKGASGRGGEWFLTGFSPRKRDLTLYIMAGTARYPALMAKLGKHKAGKGCLYVKRLADVEMGVLEELIAQSVGYLKRASV
jgi:Domain of unknown function (DU1801)